MQCTGRVVVKRGFSDESGSPDPPCYEPSVEQAEELKRMFASLPEATQMQAFAAATLCIAYISGRHQASLQVLFSMPTAGPTRDAQLMSRKFHEADCLTWEDKIVDGFYDPGGSRDFLDDLTQYQGVVLRSDYDTGRREVIVIDSRYDERLRRALDVLKTLSRNTDPRAKLCEIKSVIGTVSGRYEGDKEERCERDLLGKPVIRQLGSIREGVCRHFSLLAKYFADHLGIPAWLQRGSKGGRAPDSRHSWAVYYIAGRMWTMDVADEASVGQSPE
ncbi:putative Protein kinase domain [Diplonema papillatum]|nr:putative Protein kinase domain [Diplonema papillatum]